MLRQSSSFIWIIFIFFHLCLLTPDQIHASSGIVCKTGEKVSLSGNKCEPCPGDQYNNKPGNSNECRNCEPCASYSSEVSPCTSISNTKCRCFEGFTPLEKNERRCMCRSGLGIKHLENEVKICETCPTNTFTNKSNSECQPMQQPKFPGNATPDVSHGTEATTGVLTSSRLPLPQTSNSTSTVIPTTSRNSISTPTTSVPELQDNSKHAIWLAFLIAFLLLILILKLSRCPEKKTDIERQGSACGKPVEESGEKFLSV